VIVIPVVFTLMFTYLLGGALAGSPGRYLSFLLPGTLVMAVLLVSMYAGIGLNTDVSTGITDRFRSLPIWRPAPIAGAILGDVARYLIAAGLVTALGVIIGYRPPGGAPGVLQGIGLLLIFALCLTWAWTALALVLRTPQAVMSIGTVALFPLTLASNVFVSQPPCPDGCRPSSASTRSATWSQPNAACCPATRRPGRSAWVLVAAAALLAVFAPLTGYLYARRA
jgi:ABC-2 type transport system permease protein